MKDQLLEHSLETIKNKWLEKSRAYECHLIAEKITINPSELTSIIDKAIEDITWIENYIKTNGYKVERCT